MTAVVSGLRCLTSRAPSARRASLYSQLSFGRTTTLVNPAHASSVFARCLVSSPSPPPSRRSADTRADINLISNRPPVDALLSAYAQSPSAQSLTPLLATLGVHQHLYQLSAHFRTKLSPASATAQLFFAPSSSSSSPADTHKASPAAISFDAVSVVQLEDEVLSERIAKTFCVAPPTAASSTAKPPPIVVESEWRTERNKVRGMGVQSHSMRVLVHVPCALTAAFPVRLSSRATRLTADYASFVLTDSHDAGGLESDAELMSVLPTLMSMGGLSRAEWVWLMADLCTFPSDVAFDVLSAALENGDTE